ncbi:MAG TPA: SpoIID/LytB domain-containing protein [Calditerricola sp.]
MRKRIAFVMALVSLLVETAAWPGALPPASVAEAAGGTIRVALFIDIGELYRDTRPAYTLSSPSGLTVYGAAGGSRVAYLSAGSGQAVKVAVDTPVLRWSTGPFASLDEAHAMQSRIRAAVQNGALAAGAAPRVAALPENGSVRYYVWTGNDTTPEAHQKTGVVLEQLVPERSFEPVDALLKRVFPNGSPRYVLIDWPGGTVALWTAANEVVRLVPKPSGGVPVTAVAEKGGRTYRGEMEVRVVDGKLALINELPLEQYLYGVVGVEIGGSSPPEALKAQAVIARTYALRARSANKPKYKVAHLSDSTFDQAYQGYKAENDAVRRAVDATSGMVLTYNGQLAETLYYSNAGGMTADGSEVWGNPVPYLKPVASPDTLPHDSAPVWYRVAAPGGIVGYVHSGYVKTLQERHPLGLSYGVTTTSLNVRIGPSAQLPVRTVLPGGTRVVLLETVKENNPYRWIAGPFTGEALAEMINNGTSLPVVGRVEHLEVAKRGPSGRVIELRANGLPIAVKYPDQYRSLFRETTSSGSTVPLRSTKFDVEEMGRFAVLAAGGKTAEFPDRSVSLAAVSASGGVSQPNGASDVFFALGASGRLRVVAKDAVFRFHGAGYGHGLGLSQYGAISMAKNGKSYNDILQHYYPGTTIEKR